MFLLSDYALKLLAVLPRLDECPYVFVWPDTKQRVCDPVIGSSREERTLDWSGLGFTIFDIFGQHNGSCGR